MKLLDDALSLEAAGCFALVPEAVPGEVAHVVTERRQIPTIGIGAGAATAEPVRVFNDRLGIFQEFKPRLVKRYAHLRRTMVGAVSAFTSDVRAQRFPAPEHGYAMRPDELHGFRSQLGRSVRPHRARGTRLPGAPC